MSCMCPQCLMERTCTCAALHVEFSDHEEDCDYRALIELGVGKAGQAVMDAAMEVGICEPNLGMTVEVLTARFRH